MNESNPFTADDVYMGHGRHSLKKNNSQIINRCSKNPIKAKDGSESSFVRDCHIS